jgi:hypothetical protein
MHTGSAVRERVLNRREASLEGVRWKTGLGLGIGTVGICGVLGTSKALAAPRMIPDPARDPSRNRSARRSPRNRGATWASGHHLQTCLRIQPTGDPGRLVPASEVALQHLLIAVPVPFVVAASAAVGVVLLTLLFQRLIAVRGIRTGLVGRGALPHAWRVFRHVCHNLISGNVHQIRNSPGAHEIPRPDILLLVRNSNTR